MTQSARTFGTLIALVAVVWHALSVLTPAWVDSVEQKQARDFASYYYAVKVASDGGDAYNKAQLNNAARLEGTRVGVHPFLYAPPFLLGMSWIRAFDLGTAFHLWFWVDEALAIATAIALWRWWREFSPWAGVIVAVSFGLMTAIPNNHAMGQANFPGLLLSLLGLHQTERGRPILGGALMGMACMAKMSPALFVIWWMVRREWTAVASSIVTGAILSVLALPFAGPAVQLEFYTKILPQFSSGAYNGLSVPISLFGNHSIPNVLDEIWPGTPAGLSTTAHVLSTVIAVALLALLAWLFREPPPERRFSRFDRAAQASAYGVLLLLLPVYTYEHHLVFALPAVVISVLAIERGRLSPGWIAALVPAITVLLFELQILKSQSTSLAAIPGAGLGATLNGASHGLSSAGWVGLAASAVSLLWRTARSAEWLRVPAVVVTVGVVILLLAELVHPRFGVPSPLWLLAGFLQEAKFFALLALFAVTTRIGTGTGAGARPGSEAVPAPVPT